MKQPSLFDDDGSGPSLPALGVPGSAAALTKAQKQFNKMVARIAAQREELARWQAFLPVYQKRVAGDFEPLRQKLREARIEMVKLLDRALDGRALNKTQRAKTRDIVLGQLDELLTDEPDPDPELIRLHDKHADESYETVRQDDEDFMRALASDVFGIDPDADDAPTTPEQIAEHLAARARQDAQEGHAPPPEKPRKKSPKAQAREALREQAAHGATRAMREVYRKLASELHPDREPDEAERRRKTALMQRANTAYEAGDLLALLELQLAIEQIDPAALANMAQDRLAHYNRVLTEQSQRLAEELADLTVPFGMVLGGRGPLTTEAVLRALDADVAGLRTTLKQLRADVLRYADLRVLKEDLRHYHVGGGDDVERELMQALLAQMQPRPRGRRRR